MDIYQNSFNFIRFEAENITFFILLALYGETTELFPACKNTAYHGSQWNRAS